MVRLRVALLLALLTAACGRPDASEAQVEVEVEEECMEPVRGLPRFVDPDWVHFTTPAVAVGDLAPDFELPDALGAGTHRLSALRGRAVLLVFASYT